ncbi:MAG: hypothetical protein IJD82_08980 [Clostridia bacterium]|nr:hypothetical protein [Clostridia bacterium]
MNDRKYPAKLFILGLVSNILFRFFWLFVPAIVLLIIGIFIKPCLYIGLLVLLADMALSLIGQIRIRQTFLAESDNPSFKAFQESLSKDGDWKENIGDFLSQKIAEAQHETESENEDE